MALYIDAQVPKFSGPIAGEDQFDVPTNGVTFQQRCDNCSIQDIEVAVQLYVTGSTDGQKIADLQIIQVIE